jgi:hypothetical protein
MPDYDERRPQSNARTSSTGGALDADSNAQQLVGNAAVVEYVRQNNHATGERELDPNKNGIVYMGFNEYAPAEAQALNRLNRGSGGAITATPQADQDVANVGGTKVDLKTLDGASAFASSLGLPDQLAVNVAQFLMREHGKPDQISDARDELAQLIRVLAEAEMGERQIDRMVLSGHSVGSELWGDGNGEVSFDKLEELFKMFPKASLQVQHLMMSACYGGGETTMGEYQQMMPGLQSIWAYHDSSPGTWTGAIDHMGAWEKATETGKPTAGVDSDLAGRFRKGKNVATWNSADGYQGPDAMSIEEVEDQLNDQEAVFQSHYSGAQDITNPQAGPLRVYYGLVQRAISHADATLALRAKMTTRRDVTIRLLYYGLVSGKFQAHNRTALDEGFRQSGLNVPDLSSVGRGGMKKLISELEAAGGGTESSVALDLLKRGLWQLDTDLIPTSWI